MRRNDFRRILNQYRCASEQTEEVGIGDGNEATGIAIGEDDLIAGSNILVHHECHLSSLRAEKTEGRGSSVACAEDIEHKSFVGEGNTRDLKRSTEFFGDEWFAGVGDIEPELVFLAVGQEDCLYSLYTESAVDVEAIIHGYARVALDAGVWDAGFFEARVDQLLRGILESLGGAGEDFACVKIFVIGHSKLLRECR